MADRIRLFELEESMMLLKSKVHSGVSTTKLAATYVRVIDDFVQFYRLNTSSLSPKEIVAQYYEHVTTELPEKKAI